MRYYFDICDTTIKIKTERKHLLSQTQHTLKKCNHIKHTIKNPNFFDIAETFKVFINSHTEKFDLYLIKYDLMLVFDNEFYPHIEAEVQISQADFKLQKFLFEWTEHYIDRGHKLSHISDMNITAISNKS